jgi:hypothetical protein
MKTLIRWWALDLLKRVWWGLLVVVVLSPSKAASLGTEESSKTKALTVVEAAIEAMGGDAYLGIESTYSSGRYFEFVKDQKGFAQYEDWTVYRPVKWRFQQGKGKRQFVRIYNMEVEKGWTLEGKDTVKEIPAEFVQRFGKSTKEDLFILLCYRLEEEGMNLFYYGPNDIAGQGEYEAVEFLDITNKSLVVYFDRQSHLPAKVETHSTDEVGVRHKEELEMSNWHVIQDIQTPLRFDFYVDGEVSWQRFLEEITFNPEIPPEYFLEPVVEEKK